MPPNHGSNSQTHLPGIPLVPPHIRKKTSLRTLDFQLSTPGPWKDLGIRCRRQSVVSTQPSTVLVAPFLAQLAPENRSYPYIFTKVKFFPFRTPATPCENAQNLQRKVSLQTLSNDEGNPVPSSIRQYFGLTTICGNTLNELHGGSWWQYTNGYKWGVHSFYETVGPRSSETLSGSSQRALICCKQSCGQYSSIPLCITLVTLVDSTGSRKFRTHLNRMQKNTFHSLSIM